VRLSEWTDQQVRTVGPEPWARRVIADRIRELGTNEDPVVFATYTGSTRDQPLATIRLLAALAAGLATISVTTDPTYSVDANLSLAIVTWPTIGPTLRFEMTGDPEARLPAVTIGDERIEARHDRSAELTAFYLEATRMASA
jgi:hypothetical protein